MKCPDSFVLFTTTRRGGGEVGDAVAGWVGREKGCESVRSYQDRVHTCMTLWREVVWVAAVKREGCRGSCLGSRISPQDVAKCSFF